jgi:cyclic-di-GMP-binding protein
MNDSNESTALQITDLSDGAAYLEGLMLANPAIAERQLIRLIDALLAAPPDPGVLFPLLEQIRVPLCFVEEELALSYQNKPIPLGDHQELAFQMVLQAWRKIGKAYALCASLEEPDTDNPDYKGLMATILHRCIYYVGMVILDHYRARRELPAGIWLELHGFYETAEQWGLEFTLVSDPLENSVQATHCAAAYINLLLIEVASPYSNSVRTLNLIRRWASMWAPLVGIHRLDDDLELPPYVLELMKDSPLHPSAALEGTAKDARCLDTTRLGLQIEHAISQLHQRISPSQLGLGEDNSSHVISLLEQVAKPWKQSAAPRRFRRFSTEGRAHLVTGFEAMYFHIAGEAFEQPDSAAAYSRAQYEQLFTFGDRVDPGQGLKIRADVNFPTEDWSVINHSATGFRLGRSGAGQRITHGELMAICPHDGESFLLAYATWLMQERSGGLIVGVATLPGLPRGIAFRQLDQAGGVRVDVRYAPAFILPALPAMKEDSSLVLPPGAYQAGRDLELVDGKTIRRVRMNRILQRQIAFDRISIIEL